MRFGRRRKTKRKVYGFLCDPVLRLVVKAQSEDLNVRNFSVAEHALELGLYSIDMALRGEESRKKLREHLVTRHQVLPGLNRDDEVERRILKKEESLELDRQELGDVAREVARICNEINVPPDLLLAVAERVLPTIIEKLRREMDIPPRR
jgi:hypothetical protein